MSAQNRDDSASTFELLHRIGIALSAERDKERLLEMILLEAKKLCHADGGTLYLRTDTDELRFAIMRTDSLDIALGGTTGKAIQLPALPLRVDGKPNERNVATCAAIRKAAFNIPDAYAAEGFDFSGTKIFDERNGFRSQSFLTIPLVNNEDEVIGVLQLLNAKDEESGETIPFSEEKQRIVEALASQAAIALDNQLLLEAQKDLLESFIKLIASAIDAKSPYTGGHCERVPLLAQMLAEAACDEENGKFESFTLSKDEWYELRIASWLHDCGKVVTPVHVMDKATKLETIHDRMQDVRSRFEILKRDSEIAYLKGIASGGDPEVLSREKSDVLKSLEEDLAFLESANRGGECLSPDKKERIQQIGSREYEQAGTVRKLLSEDEVRNLQISRGTLNDEERLVINEHIVQTLEMLGALPFPRNLSRVPEYAGGHHEKMDGTGYPKGIYAGDMSIPARIMAIADVFEALTAQDRPYKSGKTLSESVRIMGFMKKDNHLDPDLLDLFIRSGVYRKYGEKYLPRELMDEVDEDAFYAIAPTAYSLPPEAERKSRFRNYLPEYARRIAEQKS